MNFSFLWQKVKYLGEMLLILMNLFVDLMLERYKTFSKVLVKAVKEMQLYFKYIYIYIYIVVSRYSVFI